MNTKMITLTALAALALMMTPSAAAVHECTGDTSDPLNYPPNVPGCRD